MSITLTFLSRRFKLVLPFYSESRAATDSVHLVVLSAVPRLIIYQFYVTGVCYDIIPSLRLPHLKHHISVQDLSTSPAEQVKSRQHQSREHK